MWILIFTPFVLQAVCIGIDELYFHRKRGLPKWERIGHPLDTAVLLICVAFARYASFSSKTLICYLILGIFSCLMVTKDEFVHKHFCPAAENWLHALLFLLHPISLTAVGLIWAFLGGAPLPFWLHSFFSRPMTLKVFLSFQIWSISGFLLYQIIFWNFLWKERIAVRH
jgi:hypothetical protein